MTSREGATAPVLSVNYCLPASGTTYDLDISVDPVEGGTTNPAAGTHTYAENTVVNITATPATGYVFDYWSGDCTGSGTCSVTMSAAKSVTAHFVVAHKLTLAVFTDRGGPGGTTSPAVGDHWYATGTVVPVTATANTGYSFAIWSGGSCTGTDPDVCSVTMDADRTVEANFTINTWPLYLTFAGTGGGHVTSAPSGIDCTPSCNHNFDYSTTPVVLTAVAATGSQFTGWSGESCSGTGTCSVTMTTTRNVTATFNTIPTHNLTVAVDPVGGGTTDPAVGIHTYNEGDGCPHRSHGRQRVCLRPLDRGRGECQLGQHNGDNGCG